MIRAVSLPGFNPVMGLLTLPGIRHVGIAGLNALSRTVGPEFSTWRKDLEGTEEFDIDEAMKIDLDDDEL
jgi:hypothetical protein